MKKLLSILLVLLLVMAILPTAALADGPAVVLSNQNLRVDGKRIQCEKYNIDGSNYFKLRDLAYVLNGTGSQFSVSWDGANKCISIVTGESYEPNGTELDLSFGDKSATAIPSVDKLLINGVDRSDLSAYKFEGNNFYKLRELGDALGFFVDYDKPSNTMIVISHAKSWPTDWRVVETFLTNNAGGSEHSVATYDEAGRILTNWQQYDTYSERIDYFYNDLGYTVQESYSYASEYEGEVWEQNDTTTYEYDMWGQMVKSVTTSTGSSYDEPSISQLTYTFDDNGLLLVCENVNPYNGYIQNYSYDERGNLIKTVTTYSYGDTYIVEYERDEQGRTLVMRSYDGEGNVNYTYEYEYAGDLTVKDVYTSGDYRNVTTYTYDENGNLIRRDSDTTDWDYFNEYTYDEEGRILEAVYYDGADMFTSRYTYDAEGRTVHEEYDNPDYTYSIDYTYDAEGNPLTEVYTGSDYNSRTEYTYDLAEGKQTVTTVIEYPAAEELVISDQEMTLAVGDVGYLYYYFRPYNCAQENVTLSSSDESVVEVDGEGNVFAVGAGTAVVTATSENGLTASCTVTVAAKKFSLSVAATDLTVGVGETLHLHCTIECVGNWMPCTLSVPNHDVSIITVRWADQWDTMDEIDLLVTGVAAGTTSFMIQQREKDGDTVYDMITVNVKVSDENTDAKP